MLLTIVSKIWNSKARPVIVLLATLVFGVGIGRYGVQTKITTTTETAQTDQTTSTDNKEVTVISNIDQKKTDKRQTHTIITKKPDGTTVTEIFDLDTNTVFTDNRKDVTDNTQKTATDTSTKIQESSTTTTSNPQPKWHVGAMAGVDIKAALGGKVPMAYGGSVDYRVLGPVTVGGFGLTNGTVGLSVGLGF